MLIIRGGAVGALGGLSSDSGANGFFPNTLLSQDEAFLSPAFFGDIALVGVRTRFQLLV